MLGKTNRFQKHLWHKWHVWQSFAFVSDITCNIGAKIKLPTVCSFPFPAGAFSKQSWGLSSHIESNFKLYLIPVSYRPKRELLLNPANHLPTNHCHSTTRTLQGPTLLLFHWVYPSFLWWTFLFRLTSAISSRSGIMPVPGPCIDSYTVHRQLPADRFPPGTGPRSCRGRRVSLKYLRPAERQRARAKKNLFSLTYLSSIDLLWRLLFLFLCSPFLSVLVILLKLRIHSCRAVDSYMAILRTENTESWSNLRYILSFFFSSGSADHALRLGPYMRRSCW